MGLFMETVVLELEGNLTLWKCEPLAPTQQQALNTRPEIL